MLFRSLSLPYQSRQKLLSMNKFTSRFSWTVLEVGVHYFEIQDGWKIYSSRNFFIIQILFFAQKQYLRGAVFVPKMTANEDAPRGGRFNGEGVIINLIIAFLWDYSAKKEEMKWGPTSSLYNYFYNYLEIMVEFHYFRRGFTSE